MKEKNEKNVDANTDKEAQSRVMIENCLFSKGNI